MLSRTVKDLRYGVSDCKTKETFERKRRGRAEGKGGGEGRRKGGVPCTCEWCWGERRCPAGGGGLWESRIRPRRSGRCGLGRRAPSDAAHEVIGLLSPSPCHVYSAAGRRTCVALCCCPDWDVSRSPLLMGGRSVLLLRGNRGGVSRSVAVGLKTQQLLG